MIYSLKFTKDNWFPLKIKLFLKVFSISLSLFSTNISFYYFLFKKKIWACLIDIMLFFSFQVIYILQTFVIVCYVLFFSPTTKFF